MKGRKTTLEDCQQVLDLKHTYNRTHGEIVKETGLSGNTITRIFDGWRPTGRKPVKLVKRQPAQMFSATRCSLQKYCLRSSGHSGECSAGFEKLTNASAGHGLDKLTKI